MDLGNFMETLETRILEFSGIVIGQAEASANLQLRGGGRGFAKRRCFALAANGTLGFSRRCGGFRRLPRVAASLQFRRVFAQLRVGWWNWLG